MRIMIGLLTFLSFVVIACKKDEPSTSSQTGVQTASQKDKKAAKAAISKFQTVEQIDQAMSELRSFWDDLLGRYQVKTHDSRIDRMVNIWNAYQCMVTFNFSRSASYFESGIGRGMGFRDSNQDLFLPDLKTYNLVVSNLSITAILKDKSLLTLILDQQ